MNKFRKLPIVTVILFLIGVLVTAVSLFNLSNEVATTIPESVNNWASKRWMFYNAYIIIGFVLLLGCCSVLVLMLGRNNSDEVKIVYVDKYSSNKIEDIELETTQTSHDNTEEIENRIKNIKSILTNNGEVKKTLDKALSFICNYIEASQGAIFLKAENEGRRVVRLQSSFAYQVAESAVIEYELGEGLTGQVAKEGKMIKVDDVPEGYIKIFSGLGKATPSHLVFIPIKKRNDCVGVIEIS